MTVKFWFYLHNRKESLASKQDEVPIRGDWLDRLFGRFQSVDRNDGIGKSKFIPLSTEVRLFRRCDNRLVIVCRFEENDESGELILCQMKVVCLFVNCTYIIQFYNRAYILP